jgi:hypothetical protein
MMRTVALILLYPARLFADATETPAAGTCAPRISFHGGEHLEIGLAA